MVPARKLVYKFLIGRNGHVSGKGNDWFVRDIFCFINQAYRTVVANLIEESSQNQTIDNHLRHLLSNSKAPLKCKKYNGNCCEIELPEDFYFYRYVNLHVSNECCPKRDKEIEGKFFQGDELLTAKKNHNRKSDFFREQAIVELASDGILVHHDCAFKVKCATLSYYKKIIPISDSDLDACANVNYANWDGVFVEDNDLAACDTYLSDKIVQAALYYAAVANHETTFSELKLKEIITNNNIHK